MSNVKIARKKPISNPVVTAALPPATVYRINSSFAVNSDTAPPGVSAE
jgi:hypothetical protein